MSRATTIFGCLLLLLLAACGGSSGTAADRDLDADLVGRWRYQSTNIYEILEVRMRAFLVDLDPSGDSVDATVSQVLADLQANRQFYDPEEILVLASDGTRSDSRGRVGRWWTDGGVVTLTGISGPDAKIAYAYRLDGDTLTLTTGKAEVLSAFADGDGVDDSFVGIFSAVFDEQDRFTYVLVRLD